MFSFFKKKTPPTPSPADSTPEETATAPAEESAELPEPPTATPTTPQEPAGSSGPADEADSGETADADADADADAAEAPLEAPAVGDPAEPTEPEAETVASAEPAAKPSSGFFSFFRKKSPPASPAPAVEEAEAEAEAENPSPTPGATLPAAETPPPVVESPPVSPPAPTPAPAPAPLLAPAAAPKPTPAPTPAQKPAPPIAALSPAISSEVPVPVVTTAVNAMDVPVEKPMAASEARKGWLDRLKAGLRRTGASIATVFTGTQIDDALYEELEDALLMADTGVKATEVLLADLKKRVKEAKATDPAAVKGLLAEAITAMLKPLEKSLVIGEHKPTVVMVAGVNGAGKTTSIGKLTRHLANEGASVLLAAADTFRAAAREQLAVWADRNTVEIITQEGGDPAAVSFDAVTAGRARKRDVVLVDTAGRLPTQLHLMEELRKIKRVVQKADPTGPHEVLLVIDGNTGQNALAQVKAFDEVLGLTGLVITKLDGTAKGGVICAIARERPIPIYFIGVGEKLEDLETFNAKEFAQALLA